jgi:predicted transcriptional regulator
MPILGRIDLMFNDLNKQKYVHIPPKEILLKILRDGLYEANISQRQLESELGDDQSNISKKLRGERPIRIEEVTFINSLILERLVSLPSEPVKNWFTPPNELVSITSNAKVREVAELMDKKDFTQLPVFKDGRYVGIVSDYTILRRILSPNTQSKGKWLNELRELSVEQADIIDHAPVYSSEDHLAEISQALMYHYAILISQGSKYGILTRADLLKIVY